MRWNRACRQSTRKGRKRLWSIACKLAPNFTNCSATRVIASSTRTCSISNRMAEQQNIHRGLDGVVVDTTRISKVMPEINALVYFGYPVQELAEHCSFEEVAWLLWHGELPNEKQLGEFKAEERSRRELSPELLEVIKKAPRSAHPMDLLRTAV